MEDEKNAGNPWSELYPRGFQLAENPGFLLWGTWIFSTGNLEPSGSHSLHPHCFHPHSVPDPAMLKGTGPKADLGKTKGKCKQGSQREAVVLSPSPSLCSFCCLCSCLLSCPSHYCPHCPSSPFILPNSSEFLNPGALAL